MLSLKGTGYADKNFSAIIIYMRDNCFEFPVVFFQHQVLSEKGSTLKGNSLLWSICFTVETNSFLLKIKNHAC